MNMILATNLLAAFLPVGLYIILPVVALAGGGAAAYFWLNKVNAGKQGKAKHDAARLIEDAAAEAKQLKKEAILSAKEEVLALKTEFDRESKERRNEIQRTEVRIIQKEESLTKKEEQVDKKLEGLEQTKKSLETKQAKLDTMEAELNVSHQRMVEELQKVASLSKEEAKKMLIAEIEEEAKKDAAVRVREIENAAKEEGTKKAKEIIGISIQKCAADHAAEMTVSIVPLPNDDVKGRIIGREGRNIRALEQATGIDLIIDDTPEAVVLSGFDPVRREIARIALEKLIADGRIHPARIEEIVEKVKREMDASIKEAGDNALFEAKVFNVHPELVKLLGRLKYRTSYGQNVLKHSLEVSFLAGLMAAEMGADVNLCKRAGLLHDIGKAVDHEVEGTHISIGVDLAKKYRENNSVIHCIAAHHNDIEPATLEAVLVQAADAISGARPGARRESLENYVKRLARLEEIATSFAGVEKSFAFSAGREVRDIVKPEQVDDSATIFMAKEIAKKIEAELDYPGQIKVNVIRELRTVEYAK